MVDPAKCCAHRIYLPDYIQVRPVPKFIENAQLAQKYLKHRLSAQQLADEYGVSKQMVLQRLRKAGVHGKVRGRDPDNFRLPNPPFGSKVTNGQLQTNPTEMKIVRLIVELRDRQGLSFEKIATELNRRRFKNRKGGEWHRVSVKQIYQNWTGKL